MFWIKRKHFWIQKNSNIRFLTQVRSQTNLIKITNKIYNSLYVCWLPILNCNRFLKSEYLCSSETRWQIHTLPIEGSINIDRRLLEIWVILSNFSDHIHNLVKVEMIRENQRICKKSFCGFKTLRSCFSYFCLIFFVSEQIIIINYALLTFDWLLIVDRFDLWFRSDNPNSDMFKVGRR